MDDVPVPEAASQDPVSYHANGVRATNDSVPQIGTPEYFDKFGPIDFKRILSHRMHYGD